MTEHEQLIERMLQIAQQRERIAALETERDQARALLEEVRSNPDAGWWERRDAFLSRSANSDLPVASEAKPTPEQTAEPTHVYRCPACGGPSGSPPESAEATLAAVREEWSRRANLAACSFGDDIEKEEAAGFRAIGAVLAKGGSCV